MRKELVFRVEHAESRKGIYWQGSKICPDLHEYGSHPPPEDDYAIRTIWYDIKISYADRRRDNPWLFGFASIEQLRRWIYQTEWLETLHEEGFVLSIYQCERSHIGDTQAVFHKEHAVRVGEAALI